MTNQTYNKNEWKTPEKFFNLLNDEFQFTLDPAATDDNALCDYYFTKENSGLEGSWKGHTVFLNPPYDRSVGKWVEKAYNESLNPDTIVACLLPNSTDTSWWHKYVTKAYEIRFLKGRLKFGHPIHTAEHGPTFGNVIVIFKNNMSLCPAVHLSWDWRKEL